ncbi:SDR family oxidoreductase [Oleiharenicola lentus]|uniref:SDR family oxidoreductase n=1 Tax=Oleiharenicola lentus TaxID=2508720 RepID=UPI003F66B976
MLSPSLSSSLFDLNGRVIVVTGATGVLAGSAARYFAAQDATVVFLGRDQAKLDRALADTQDLPGKTVGYSCDVLDRAGLEKVRDAVVQRFGKIDALVNAAGGNQPGAVITPEKTFLDLDLGAYRQVLGLNLDGTVVPSLVFAKTFAEQKRGNIINFSSMAASQAITRVVGYSNAKAAVDNFTKWLAVEVAKKFGSGVRVNAIAPGFFVADQNRRLLLNEDGTPTARGQSVLTKTPFNRFGEAHELHGALHFLLSDASAFVTGTVIPVDGGFSCYSGV